MYSTASTSSLCAPTLRSSFKLTLSHRLNFCKITTKTTAAINCVAYFLFAWIILLYFFRFSPLTLAWAHDSMIHHVRTGRSGANRTEVIINKHTHCIALSRPVHVIIPLCRIRLHKLRLQESYLSLLQCSLRHNLSVNAAELPRHAHVQVIDPTTMRI